MNNCYLSLAIQVRVINGVPPTGDYSFAKYNKVNASVLFVFMHALHCFNF